MTAMKPLVVAFEALFAVLGSGVADETLAVSAIVPAWLTRATSVTVALEPEPSVPSEQATFFVPEQVPTVVDTDTKPRLAGRVSVTFACSAESGPALAATIVKVTLAPTCTELA